jgi:glycosyltransferase involved in cell wall biosynthesis
LKISVISDTTYRSCTPDYEHCLSFYGSEPAHAIIAKGLFEKGHDVYFFAPQGSEPIGTFHPLICFNGAYSENEILDETSLEGLKTDYLKDFDFILDFSAVAKNVESVRNYYGFKNYGVFRNGYTGYTVPRLRLADRHYIVPSVQNKRIFEKHGFTDVFVAYYGIPDDFYCAGEDPNYINLFSSNGLETGKNFYLYPHRPTPEKGSLNIIELAAAFPNETFVFMVSNNPVQQHKNALQDLKRLVVSKSLKNVKFVELPLTNKHHYYKRELMRHAKAILSPFNPSVYLEGFGLANAEAVACGTPLLITDSESSRELWIDEKDGLIIPYDDRLWGFKQAIKHFDSYSHSFEPVNKFSVPDCINNYENFIKDTIERNNNE